MGTLELLTKMDWPFAFALIGLGGGIAILGTSYFTTRTSKRFLALRQAELNKDVAIATAKNQTTQLPVARE